MSTSDPERAPLPKRKGEVWRESKDEAVAIYEPDHDGLHLLNGSALAIWELSDGSTSIDEMAHAISELTSIDMSDARRDVESALRTLSDLGLIE